MRREPSQARPDIERHFRQIGFAYAQIDGETYWDESVRYVFTLREVENDIEKPARNLAALSLELVDRIVASEATMDRLRIPAHAREVIAQSWRRRDPSLYGRFDFAYDGKGPAKLLEYNADTPTSLYESAVVQWHWLEQLVARGALPAGADQFNSLHEKLVARWREIGAKSFRACRRDERKRRGFRHGRLHRRLRCAGRLRLCAARHAGHRAQGHALLRPRRPRRHAAAVGPV